MSLEEAQHTREASPPVGAAFRDWLSRLVRTTDSVWPVILRVTLGGVMLPHGLQKTLGLFGGFGFSKTVEFLTKQAHLPLLVVLFVIFIETAGALSLIFGLFTRAAALGVGAVMVGAVLTVHWPNGFFMNWSNTQAGEGFEFHLLALAIVVALMMEGGGRAGLDRFISRALQDSKAVRRSSRSVGFEMCSCAAACSDGSNAPWVWGRGGFSCATSNVVSRKRRLGAAGVGAPHGSALPPPYTCGWAPGNCYRM